MNREAPETTQIRKKPLGQNNKIDKDMLIYKKIQHTKPPKKPSKPSNHIISKFNFSMRKSQSQNPKFKIQTE